MANQLALAIENARFYELAQQEIAERRQAEAKFQGLLEAAPDAITAVNRQGKIVFANPQTEQLFGYQTEELLGKPIEILLLEHLRSKHVELRTDYFSKPHLRPMGAGLELFGKRKDASKFPVEISLSPLETAEGTLVISAIRNITGRKQAEEKLRESNERLRNLARHLESIREEERVRIARELHDQLGQALIALKMDVTWLVKRLSENNEGLIKKTTAMSQLIGTTIKLVQKISTELRPSLLDDLGLVAAIEWQAQELQGRTGIVCQLELGPEETFDINPELNVTIFRILQETLTNIARHAQATEVNVHLTKQDSQLELIVNDNGIGITKAQIFDPKSFGLIGIQERVHPWSGQVEIKGISGAGTTVRVTISLEQQERKSQ
jgi:PAS domain S-box-containing protein